MYIQHTIQWIESIVISLNLCPFAKREMDNNSVRIEVSTATRFEQGLKSLETEIKHLNTNPSTGTTLLLFPYFLNDFLTYLDFVDLANDTIKQLGQQHLYQLATFHPAYQFHGTDIDDVTNYSNRSPYPMVHLLREDMLDQAIAYYGDTNVIPANNIRRLRQLGLAKINKILQK